MIRRIIRRFWLALATPFLIVGMAIVGAVEGIVEALGDIKREWRLL